MCATNVEPVKPVEVHVRTRSSAAKTNSPVRLGMYLVLPVPFRTLDGDLLLEERAAGELDQWTAHFARITVAAPMIPEALVSSLHAFSWRPLKQLGGFKQIVPHPLPWAYTAAAFFKQVTSVRRQMGQIIKQSEQLQFAIGGLVGDWAAVAAMEAIRLKRRYAIHSTRVEYDRSRRSPRHPSSARRLNMAGEIPLMERYHRHIVTHCALGLWHGEECYRAYAPWCVQSQLIGGGPPAADPARDLTIAAQSEMIKKFAS